MGGLGQSVHRVAALRHCGIARRASACAGRANYDLVYYQPLRGEVRIVDCRVRSSSYAVRATTTNDGTDYDQSPNASTWGWMLFQGTKHYAQPGPAAYRKPFPGDGGGLRMPHIQ